MMVEGKKAGVVGAGLMGAEIALVFALGGYEVILHDRDAAALDRGIKRIEAVLHKGVERGNYAREQADAAMGHIRTTTDLADFGACDLVTEAVFEAIEVKTAVLQALDAACAEHCVIASNTSTIPISTLAGTLAEARRACFIGTHYFSPVSRMPLVEVIPGFDTDRRVIASTIELMRDIGKTPIVIKDVAGFAVNRMLHAMMIEAVRLVEEGVASPEDLDTACRLGLGHPIGPFALMDLVSADLCLQVQSILQEAYGERFRPPALLKQRVAAGLGGGRGRRGWLSGAS
ncbi:3-hydroxyacyl-CoA dehydrogenase family protein [Hephaestia mangrovi]|uniref:3-hydroxyacyl-CoA dehydrogenase family protein n=1 Tax=Hephaestia mangrovi TaxID=2873268 RepID=UPI001CA623BD|nr:3-hydroxyacyl-CoA dehydrogenase family protein [Hephaestia mangrovi]